MTCPISSPHQAAQQRSVAAIGVTTFGGPEGIGVFVRPVRAPGSAEVRIRVLAATVNPADILMRRGAFASLFTPLEPPYVLGMDAAGVIESVGSDVADLRVGDRVIAVVDPIRPEGGAQQQLLVVHRDSVAVIADSLTFAEAATLPMNGLTAIEALKVLNISPHGTLAVTGGAGWLAALTLALARLATIQTIADGHPRDHELIRSFGADHVVARGDDMAARIREVFPGGVDGVLDTAIMGASALGVIRDGGVLAAVRPGTSKQTERGISRRLVLVKEEEKFRNRAALEQLAGLAAQGRIPHLVQRTFAPAQVAEAHRLQEAGGIRGRLVIDFAGA